jgi:hypothetical protein
MTEAEHLKELQERSKCENVRTLGVPCDAESGGWWTCMCAVAAWKLSRVTGDGQPPQVRE